MEKIFYFYFGLAIILLFIPKLITFKSYASFSGYHFVKSLIELPNVLIHEFCHAATAMLTLGRVQGLKLFSNGEGEVVSSSGNLLFIALMNFLGNKLSIPSFLLNIIASTIMFVSRLLVSLAGYVGASFFSYYFLMLLIEGNGDLIFYVFMGMAVFTLIYIRNFFGLIYVSVLLAIWYCIEKYDLITLKQHFIYYLVAIVIVQSFYSAFVILKISFKDGDNAGDSTNLKNATMIPSLIWGILFFVQASYWFYLNLEKLM